VSFKKF
jgi:aminopeptidase N